MIKIDWWQYFRERVIFGFYLIGAKNGQACPTRDSFKIAWSWQFSRPDPPWHRTWIHWHDWKDR